MILRTFTRNEEIKMLRKKLELLNDATLWALLSDVSENLNKHPYDANGNNEVFLFWYAVFKDIENAIDERLAREG